LTLTCRIYYNIVQLAEFNHLMAAHAELELPSNLKLVFEERAAGGGASYPINQLRNLALHAVATSHVLVSDADMLPRCVLTLLRCVLTLLRCVLTVLRCVLTLPSAGLCRRASAALAEMAEEELKHGTEVHSDEKSRES
jgi:hypothetical protein